MKEEFPKIIKEVGFDFDWDEKKVWKLKLPIEEMNIKELVWHFSIPFHSKEGGVYNLTSNEIFKRPEKYKEEYERVMKADINFPIDIMKNKGRWLILDGLHRLMKAKIQGLNKVKVRKVPRTEIKNIIIQTN